MASPSIYIYRIRTHALVYIDTVVDITGRKSPAPKHTPSLSDGQNTPPPHVFNFFIYNILCFNYIANITN